MSSLVGRIVSFTVVALLLAAQSSAQTITSIDVAAELNAKLAAKGGHRKQRVVQRRVRECHEGCCGKGCEADCTRCRNVNQDVVETFVEPLHVTGVSLQVVGARVEVDPHFTVLPDKFHFHESEIVNCSATRDQSETKTLAVQFQTTRTIQMTRAVAHGQTVQGNLSFSFPGVGSAGLQISGTETVTVTNMSAQTTSDTVTATDQVSVAAAPMTRAQVSLQVVEGGVQAVFRGSVIADGPVDGNIDGIATASQLLNAAERTFDVEGTLTVTSASQSRVVRHDTALTTAFCNGKPDVSSSETVSTTIAGIMSTAEPLSMVVARNARRAEVAKKLGAGPFTGKRSQIMQREKSGKNRIVIPGGTLLAEGTPGGLCYIGPCNLPLDGTRPVCYFDDDGACDDCGDEPDAVCNANLQPAKPPR